jgi:hypothetical protein
VDVTAVLSDAQRVFGGVVLHQSLQRVCLHLQYREYLAAWWARVGISVAAWGVHGKLALSVAWQALHIVLTIGCCHV